MQASLEFLLITSAIAALSLSVISLYGRNVAVQRGLLDAAANSINPSAEPQYQQAVADDPQVLIYVPPNSTVGKGSSVQITFYGCAYGTASAALSSQSVSFARNGSSADMSDIAVLAFPFTPITPGPDSINVSYSVLCGNATMRNSRSFLTYATSSADAVAALYSVSISNRSERISYTLENQDPVLNLNEWSRCTGSALFNGQSDLAQCGQNSWDYMVFSPYCYYTAEVSMTSTYCMAPVGTGYSISGAGADAEYVYNFTLLLDSPSGTMRSVLDYRSNESNVTLDGRTVGRARIESVSGDASVPAPTLISNGSAYHPINETEYLQYTQAKNNLYGTLSFYNSSSVTSDVQSEIQQAVQAFISSSSGLINAKSPSTACNVSGSAYVCNAAYPFTYVISVNMSRGMQTGNQTLYYLGSVIDVSNR
jgi:hypothetical protein